MFLTSTEGTEEVIEEVLQYNLDDVYVLLQEISGELSNINSNLNSLELLGEKMLQLLQESFLDSIAALLLILVGFEILRLVRGWVKGERYNGRNC